MTIHFTCPTCGKKFSARDESAGRKTRCTQCQSLIAIPASPTPVAPTPVRSAPPIHPPVRTVAPPSPATQTYAPPRPAVTVCPACKAPLAPGAALCLACGFHLASGRHLSQQTLALEESSSTPSFLKNPSFWIVAVLCLVLIVGGTTFLLLLTGKKTSSSSTAGVPSSATPAPGAFAAAKPTFRSYQPGIDRADVTLTGSGPAANMKLRVYLPHPASPIAAQSLGCIFIAPAGTPMFYGNAFGDDGDSPEHIPYVRAGYAVCAFELDGDVPENASDNVITQAITKFRDARFGVLNASNAITYILANVPEVDPERLYVAGHSSAGAVALLVKAQEPRIKACLAYAPGTDLNSRLNPLAISSLSRSIPDFPQILRDASPITHVPSLKGPVFIFHATGDTNVTEAQIRAFIDAMRSRGVVHLYRSFPGGDHYNSMIQSGINWGIDWLKTLPDERMAGLKPRQNDNPQVDPGRLANSAWKDYTFKVPPQAIMLNLPGDVVAMQIKEGDAVLGRITLTLAPPVPRPVQFPAGKIIQRNRILFHIPMASFNAGFRVTGYGEHHQIFADLACVPDKAALLLSITEDLVGSIAHK